MICLRKFWEALILASLLALAGCRPASNASIVFFGQMPDPDDRTGFIVTNRTGTTFHFLTNGSFMDGASWSPDAKRIAFTNSNNLYVINADGSALRKITSQLTVFAGKPSWSPDGKNLAFAAFAESGSGQTVQIFRIGDDGSGLKQLTNASDPALEPSWSPDGTKIVYTFGSNDTEIYTMSASDGSSKANLSRDPSALDISPSWDRNGFEILYLRYTPGNQNERSDLYRMAPDGSSQRVIKSGADRLNVFVPSYSPDSTKIIFQGMAPRNSDPTYAVRIYTIRPDGTDLQKLIDWGYTPDWGAGPPIDKTKVKLFSCPPFCTKPQPVPLWDPSALRRTAGSSRLAVPARQPTGANR